MIRVRPTVVRSTILILHVLGPGVQLALTVSNNDSVAFLKSLAAANLWQRMSHPGLASPDDLAAVCHVGVAQPYAIILRAATASPGLHLGTTAYCYRY